MFTNTVDCRKQKRIVQYDQSCKTHTLEGVPEDLLDYIFLLIYYVLRCKQLHWWCNTF